MTIHYIPNDPMAAGGPNLQSITPRPDRALAEVSFDVPGLPPEQAYAVGTTEFVHWQAREAALATLEAFEAVH